MAVLVALLLPQGQAAAKGGASISSAPSVVYGQQEFGNTLEGGTTPWIPGTFVYSSYWTLPVISGDSVKIDWEAEDPDNNSFFLDVLPAGTNDFNQFTVTPVASQQIASGTKNELAFSAGSTGTMPIRFKLTANIGTGGPMTLLRKISTSWSFGWLHGPTSFRPTPWLLRSH